MNSITEKVLIVNPWPLSSTLSNIVLPCKCAHHQLGIFFPCLVTSFPYQRSQIRSYFLQQENLPVYIFPQHGVSPMYHTTKHTVPLSVIRWPTSVSLQLDYKFHEGRNCTGYDCSLPSAKVKCLTHTRNVINICWGNE